jgi:hypothetical protein
MSRSLYEVDRDKKKQYKTLQNTYDMFPVGSHVQVICMCQDFHFFYDETGVVTENKGRYLSINVKFDETRHFKDGSVQTDFNFNPEDLIRIDIDFSTEL